MNILINYSDLSYYNASIRNAISGLKAGGFNKVIRYSIEDICKEYKYKH